MRKLFQIFCLAVVIMLPSGKLTAQRANINISSSLQFEEEIWDFGEIREADGPVSHIFYFTNTGQNPIVIENVTVSCGCTKPEYSKQPVMPGKRSYIKITYDPEHRPGPFNRDIFVISNAGKNRNVITIKGEVIGKPLPVEQEFPFSFSGIMRFSRLSANLGYTGHNDPKSSVIGFYNPTDKPVKISYQIVPDDGNIQISSAESICANCRGDITVTANIRTKTYGRYSYKVYPVINGKREKLSFTVTGIATDNFSKIADSERPSAEYTPNFHHFGNVKKGEKKTMEFVLANIGSSDLYVRKIDTRDGISTTLKEGTKVPAGKMVVFKVTLDSTKAHEGTFTKTITVFTNDPKRPMRDIRLAADIQ